MRLLCFAGSILLLSIAYASAGLVQAGEGIDRQIRLLPAQIELYSPEARQTLVAQWQTGDQIQQQAKNVELKSTDESVVRIEEGKAAPVANGKATITASIDGQTATAEVTVSGMDKSFAWSFRNHVESVLSKQGCNAGSCHGARAGQKGFRLTLFGFDVDADYTYLTRQAVGRRIVPTDPGRSLILTKPTGLLPHKGGVRLESGSLEYRVLSEWIASGVPGPRADDPQIERLEVLVVGDGPDGEAEAIVGDAGDDRVRWWNLPQRYVYPDVHRHWLAVSTLTRNEGYRLASGRWLFDFDDDDSLPPDAVSSLLETARERRAEAVQGALCERHPDGTTRVETAVLPDRLPLKGALVHSHLRFFERDHVASAFGIAGDWFRGERMLRAGVRIELVDRITYEYYPSSLWQQ